MWVEGQLDSYPIEQYLRENEDWLGTLQMLSFYGLDLRSPLDFDKRLAAISMESLKAESVSLLRPDTYLQVVLSPEGWGEPGGSWQEK